MPRKFSVLHFFGLIILLALILLANSKLISHPNKHKKNNQISVMAANQSPTNGTPSGLVNNGTNGSNGGANGDVIHIKPTGDQTKRLRFTNQCPYPIWIQQDFKNKTNDAVVNLIKEGQYYDFNINPVASSLRFWAKAGNCNEYGYDCSVGESVGVPDAQKAGQQKTQIFMSDINSKFEVTFDEKTTYFDASAVDGYTFAFQVLVKSPADKATQCYYQPRDQEKPIITTIAANDSILYVDCGKLDPAQFCPTNEDLSKSINFQPTGAPTTTFNNVTINSVDLRYAPPGSDTIVGCFSPCGKLTFAQDGGWSKKLGGDDGISPSHPLARLFCCPGKMQPECTAKYAPAPNTQFLKSVQDPGKGHCNAYAYAYDDAKGEMVCDAATMYEVIMCPGGNALPLPVKPAQCSDTKPCEAGQVCKNGRCEAAGCTPACKPDEVCENGTCKAKGGACAHACKAGEFCPDRFKCDNLTGTEAGCCDNHLTPCKVGCDANDTCPGGKACLTTGVGQYCCDAHVTPPTPPAQCVHQCKIGQDEHCLDGFLCDNLAGNEAGCCDNHLTPCANRCAKGNKCGDGTDCPLTGVGQFCCDAHMTPAKQCVHECSVSSKDQCLDGTKCEDLPGTENVRCCDNHNTPPTPPTPPAQCVQQCTKGLNQNCPDGTPCDSLPGDKIGCCDNHQKQ